MKIMNNNLKQVFNIYLSSQSQNIKINKEIDLISNKQKNSIMMAHLQLKYLIKIKKICNASQAGLKAVFQGKLIDAKKQYIYSNNAIQYTQLNNESLLVIKDTFNAAQGYFDYRQGDYKNAKENLQIALEACIILVNQYGYNFLQGRPIHLACNLVKIEACSGNKERAIKIACYLISIINGNCNNSLFKDINLLQSIQHLSLQDESFLLTQVVEEVAKLLASCNDQQSNQLITLANDLLEKSNLSLKIQSKREYTWLKNKQTLAQGKIEQFLEESSNFIAEGRGSCKLLWHATVLDILKICQTTDSEISRNLQQQVTEDFAKYPYLPSVLKV